MKEKYNCIPISINKEDLDLHERFCSQILYRLLHNVIDTDNRVLQYSEDLWNAYKRVNIFFSDQILTYYTDHMI